MRLRAGQVVANRREAEQVFGACVAMSSHSCRQQRGFTLIELIMTIIIVGIISVVAIPRFTSNSVFQSRGFADQVQAALRYAQKTAIAQRRNVCVAFTLPAPSTISLTIANVSGVASPCVANLDFPEGGNTITAPTGIAFAALPADFSFNGQGSPSAGQTINVTGVTNGITIEAETGYVHSP
jgi:MSHA pilin protein MshC